MVLQLVVGPWCILEGEASDWAAKEEVSKKERKRSILVY